MINQEEKDYLGKFIDLLKGELGADNVHLVQDGEANQLMISVTNGAINLNNVADCYRRTKQEFLFQCQEGLKKLPLNTDAEVMGVAKAQKILTDLIRNTNQND